MMSLICLRDQPGVGVLEWEVEQHGWTEKLVEWGHDLAATLFGVSELDIEDDIAMDDPRFEYLKLMRDEADAHWARFGWDVTDGNGKQLRVMEYLARPLACMAQKMHVDATFTGGDAAWAAQLEEDAKRFKGSRER